MRARSKHKKGLRGAGETAASGTCSAGAAVLAAFTQKTGRNVRVHATGGTTLVNWHDDDEIVITGRADLAFSGKWPHPLQTPRLD